MSSRKTGPRQGSDPTQGQTNQQPEDQVPDRHEPTGGAAGHEHDPKHRVGAFDRAGDHARQQQMGNKD